MIRQAMSNALYPHLIGDQRHHQEIIVRELSDLTGKVLLNLNYQIQINGPVYNDIRTYCPLAI